MSAIDEVTIALKAASASGLPVVVSMTYEPNGRTMMGARLEDLIAFGKEDGVVALGLNCGQGPETMLKLVERLRELDSEVPLVAQPNAGAPRLSGASAVYDIGPDDLARFALSARSLGVKVIGACCGSTPEHIRAMARALGD